MDSCMRSGWFEIKVFSSVIKVPKELNFKYPFHRKGGNRY